MGQFGLLLIPVVTVLDLLSGSTTPMESMPVVAAEHHAVRADAALRRLRPGRAVPRRRARHRLAAAGILVAFTAVFLGVALVQFRKAIVGM